jgi:hypothetical protein
MGHELILALGPCNGFSNTRPRRGTPQRAAQQKRFFRRLNLRYRHRTQGRARAIDAQQRGKARHERLSVRATQTSEGLSLSPPHDDDAAFEDTLLDAFGTTSRDLVSAEASRLAGSLIGRGETTVNTGHKGLVGCDRWNETRKRNGGHARRTVRRHALASHGHAWAYSAKRRARELRSSCGRSKSRQDVIPRRTLSGILNARV